MVTRQKKWVAIDALELKSSEMRVNINLAKGSKYREIARQFTDRLQQFKKNPVFTFSYRSAPFTKFGLTVK